MSSEIDRAKSQTGSLSESSKRATKAQKVAPPYEYKWNAYLWVLIRNAVEECVRVRTRVK